MAFLIELLLQFFLEVVAYKTGRVAAPVLLPGTRVEPMHRRAAVPRWNWCGFTYAKGKHRYLYTESIQVLGIGVWIVLGTLTWIVVRSVA